MRRTNSIRLVVTADICPNHGLADEIVANGAEAFVRPLLPLFRSADAVIGNLETPLCEEPSPIPKTGPNFMAPPAVLPALTAVGFGCFTLCNNHICDQGVAGLRRTLEVLDAAGVAHCGAGLTHAEACRPAVLDIEGCSVAVVNVGEGEFAQAQEEGPGAARMEAFWPEERMTRLRDQVDVMIAILHVGNEYQPIPSPVTVSFCRRLAAAGADAVIAHHAHIPQCVEIYRGTPICFSLGNFLFGYPLDKDRFDRHPEWFLGSVAELVCRPEGVRMDIHPFRQTADRTLAGLSAAGREAFDLYMDACARIVADPVLHQRLWEQEVRDLFPGLRRHLRQCSADLESDDPEVAHRAATILYNQFRCDAHRAATTRGLRLMYEGQLGDDPEAAAELARLRALIRECFSD